jgi:hypothetical protein
VGVLALPWNAQAWPALSNAKYPKQTTQAAAAKAPPTLRYLSLLAEIDLVDTLAGRGARGRCAHPSRDDCV